MRQLWSTLRTLLPLLPAGAGRFFVLYVIATCSVTILDVLALGLLALVITPTVSNQPINIPLFGTFEPSAAPLLILIACGFIILKSASALSLHWIATGRFAKYELETGQRLFRAYVHSSWEERSRRTVAEITRIADAGIGAAVAGFIVPLTLIPAAATTFVLVLSVLIISDPVAAVIAFLYLGGIALLINKVITKRALVAGQVNRDYSYATANLMTEMVDALKELSLRAKLGQMVDLVTNHRRHSVRARRHGNFLSVISGYAFEAALLGGFVLVGATSYLTGGLAAAVSSIALFAVTGFRLIPALNAVQAGIVLATQSLPAARDVIEDLVASERSVQETTTVADATPLPDSPRLLRLSGVRFRYAGGPEVLRGLDLDIPFGSSLGIVGPSGAGKSTLIDLLLGLSQPTDGSLEIDDIPLRDVLHAWRSRVGYVPQRVALFDGTIAQNVALTWDDDYDPDRVRVALERAQLSSLVNSREHGIDERIGERGVSLSGGQQQRLGIARALYTDPLVLVLDEATSSLDTKTEDDVTRSIKSLQGQVTLISVAHRLSTIKDYDRVCYLDEGRMLGQGTFAEVAASVPAFGEQVALAGLSEHLRR